MRGNHSVVQQDVLELGLELALEVLVEPVEAEVRLRQRPAPDDADVEQVEVRRQFLVHALLELRDIFIGAQPVYGGQTDILQLDQAFLDQSLVVLCDLDGAQVGRAPVVAGDVAVVVQQLLQLVVEWIGRRISRHLHYNKILFTTHPQLYKREPHSHSHHETLMDCAPD